MPKIAVLDDDSAVLDCMRLLYKCYGYECVTFSEPEALLSWWNQGQQTPDVFILDVRMPGMSGLEVLSLIRESDETTPIVIYTGHGDVEMSVNAMHLGADDFILKPAREAHMSTVIERLINEGRPTQQQHLPQGGSPDCNALIARREPMPPWIVSALGELVGSYCHDIANTLALSNGYMELARREDMDKHLATALLTNERASQHLLSLHTFVRSLYREAADPLQTIGKSQLDERIREIHRSVGAQGMLQVNLARLPDLVLPAILVGALLYPIIQNAAEATTTANALHLFIELEVDSLQNALQITVGDNGPGWPKDPDDILRDLPTNSSFTTKGQGRGNGLRNLHRLVSRLGGGLRIANRSQGGAAVFVRMPLAGVVHAQ